MKKTVILSMFKIEVVCFHERGLVISHARSETANKICQEITRLILRLHGGEYWTGLITVNTNKRVFLHEM